MGIAVGMPVFLVKVAPSGIEVDSSVGTAIGSATGAALVGAQVGTGVAEWLRVAPGAPG